MNDHRLPLPLVVLLGLIIGLAVLGLGRSGAHSVESALGKLEHGTLDEAERTALLEVVRDGTAKRAHSDRHSAQLLASAAIALSDEDALSHACEALGGATCFRDAELEAGQLGVLAFGEPATEALIRGMVAETGGDALGARASYAQAEAAGRMWSRPLAVRLAREGLSRVR